MALKVIFDTMKREGYIVPKLDRYLLSLDSTDNDRAIDVNAPSSVLGCKRAIYYSRTGIKKDAGAISPRTRRIFDNGSYTHERIQKYLRDEGMLLMDEIPILHERLNIQGHTDGLVKISNLEVAVLEIKSINSNGFEQLKDAKEEHKAQALVYMFCLEERRKLLQKKYKDLEEFELDTEKRYKWYAKFYQHFVDGKKFTREQKIGHQCNLLDASDRILLDTARPISKVILLYENKNDQNLKEYCVVSDAKTRTMIADIKEVYEYLNECVAEDIVPERIGTSKSCQACKWCNFKTNCWVL